MAQQAIGMIETKGLIGSVEGLDAALKAANVKYVRPSRRRSMPVRKLRDVSAKLSAYTSFRGRMTMSTSSEHRFTLKTQVFRTGGALCS